MVRKSSTYADLDPDLAMQKWQQSGHANHGLRQIYHCETTTPLYGGGVKAAEVDEAMPIRASSIRGQLRFWWRLLNGQGKGSKDLFKDEIAIWGGISATEPQASKVRVAVRGVKGVSITPAFVYEKRSNGRYEVTPTIGPGLNSYALFPAQGKLAPGGQTIEEKPHSVAQAGIHFELSLESEASLTTDQQSQVIEALRWWASFGGVGARTRRGLGAVKVQGLDPVSEQEVVAKGGRLMLGDTGGAISCWNRGIDALKRFRQGTGVGRNPGSQPNRPGRSRWPEADELRRVSHRHVSNHAPEHPVENLYPRAAFGLPIVFHFKDKQDPQDSNLEPDGAFERMASPLILRPYWDGQNYSAMALLLPGWQYSLTQPLKLRNTRHHGLSAWPKDTVQQQKTATQIRPMSGHGYDPLSAFIDFFIQEAR